MTYLVNTNQKKAAVAISMSKKGDFRAREIIGDKEDCCTKVNGYVYKDDTKSVCTSSTIHKNQVKMELIL